MTEEVPPALLHLCDSLFPTGGYVHSDGLEAAVAAGLVSTPDGVRVWVEALLDRTLRASDGPAAGLAWEYASDGRLDSLRRLDDEVYALRPSASGREALRAVGTRLLKTWDRLHPGCGLRGMLDGLHGPAWTSPVAFAAACVAVRVSQRSAIEGFLYTRVAATASAAMRLLPLGQADAHAMVADAGVRIPAVAADILTRRARPGAFTPLVDLMTMQHQYVTTRLFRS